MVPEHEASCAKKDYALFWQIPLEAKYGYSEHILFQCRIDIRYNRVHLPTHSELNVYGQPCKLGVRNHQATD